MVAEVYVYIYIYQPMLVQYDDNVNKRDDQYARGATKEAYL